MPEGELVCVQAQPLKFAAAAFYVTHDRMADRRAMYPKLICAARYRFEFEQRRGDETFLDQKPRLGVLAVVFYIPVFLVRISPDRRRYSSLVLGNNSIDQREIFFFNQLFLKMLGEHPMRMCCLCNDDQSGSLSVETMDEAGPCECGMRSADCGFVFWLYIACNINFALTAART
jgi:hypothetical protein